MNNEPVAVGAAVIGFFNALLAALALIVELTPEAVAALNGVIVALVALVAAIIRQKVTPVFTPDEEHPH